MNKKTKFLRLPQVMERTGFARSTIYLLMSKGSFPKSVKAGTRMVAWLESEIDNWLEDKVNLSRKSEDAK